MWQGRKPSCRLSNDYVDVVFVGSRGCCWEEFINESRCCQRERPVAWQSWQVAIAIQPICRQQWRAGRTTHLLHRITHRCGSSPFARFEFSLWSQRVSFPRSTSDSGRELRSATKHANRITFFGIRVKTKHSEAWQVYKQTESQSTDPKKS